MNNSFLNYHKTDHIIKAIGDDMPNNIEDCQKLIAILTVNLLQVWQQYNTLWSKGLSENEVGHACMTAGERAIETLEHLGIVSDCGWFAEIKEPFLSSYKKGIYE